MGRLGYTERVPDERQLERPFDAWGLHEVNGDIKLRPLNDNTATAPRMFDGGTDAPRGAAFDGVGLDAEPGLMFEAAAHDGAASVLMHYEAAGHWGSSCCGMKAAATSAQHDGQGSRPVRCAAAAASMGP